MGTRGAWGFHLNGKDKITYNHFDSYPTFLGKVMMTFVRDAKVVNLREVAERIKLVKEDARPSAALVKKYAALTDDGVGIPGKVEWYKVLHMLQRNPSAYLDPRVTHMIDSHHFLKDSLFCEWAYVVNLDTMMLEIYRGFNTAPTKTGRYWDIEPHRTQPIHDLDKNEVVRARSYYGVSLLREIPFEQIWRMTDEEIEKWCKHLEDEVYGREETEAEEARKGKG